MDTEEVVRYLIAEKHRYTPSFEAIIDSPIFTFEVGPEEKYSTFTTHSLESVLLRGFADTWTSILDLTAVLPCQMWTKKHSCVSASFSTRDHTPLLHQSWTASREIQSLLGPPWENHTDAYRCHVDIYILARRWDMKPLYLYARAHLQNLGYVHKPFAGRLDDLKDLIRHVYAKTSAEEDRVLREIIAEYAANAMEVYRSWGSELYALSEEFPEFTRELTWTRAFLLPPN